MPLCRNGNRRKSISDGGWKSRVGRLGIARNSRIEVNNNHEEDSHDVTAHRLLDFTKIFSTRMLESLDLSSAQVDLLNTIAFELSKIPGVIAVVLGGSYARRTARPDSDLDVGLYYSKNSPPDIEAIRRVLCRPWHAGDPGTDAQASLTRARFA